MAERWLVDGMNVVGARPDGWWRDRQGAMRSLAERLEAFARETGDDVTVVFDTPLEDPPGERLQVLSARRRGPNAADDEIARLVEGDSDPASLCVVTSDADLGRRVEERGARVVGAGAFRRRVDACAGDRERRAGARLEDRDPG